MTISKSPVPKTDGAFLLLWQQRRSRRFAGNGVGLGTSAMKEMNPEALTGRTITNVFETKPSIVQEGIPGPASYFDIIIEIDGSDLYTWGVHKILRWTKKDELIPYEKSVWEVENNLNVIGKKITGFIQRDPQAYYDGSLTLIVDNNTIMEHQATNGDQLFIDQYREENSAKTNGK